jgi:hypothetical protein
MEYYSAMPRPLALEAIPTAALSFLALSLLGGKDEACVFTFFSQSHNKRKREKERERERRRERELEYN